MIRLRVGAFVLRSVEIDPCVVRMKGGRGCVVVDGGSRRCEGGLGCFGGGPEV